MSTFTTLNDYSADDVVLTVDDQLMLLPEGANVRMPLLAWTPIHDIGDPFDGTGVQITHTFYPGSITMSNGQILTYDEYLGFVENKPSTTAVGNIQIVNTPVNFGTESILYHTNTANGYVNVDMEPSGFDIADDFCFECWYWPTAVQSGFDWIFSYGGFKFGLSLLNALELNLTIEGTTYQYYLRSPGTYPEFLNQWHHFAVVRLNGQVRTFVDGVLYGSSVASTTDYSHYAPDITIGKNSGSGSIHGYIDGARFSNVARYNTTGSITVPTANWALDNNTVFQIEAVDAAVVDTANIYALNRVLNVPLQLRGGSPNVTMTNTATNTWEIKYIHTPEDYLAGDVYLDYPPDYAGIGNAEVNGTLDWTTNIKNLDVLEYDFTFNVHLEIEDFSEFSGNSLANIPYVTGTDVELSQLQKVYITDRETLTGNYTLTLTTQSSATAIQIESAAVANLITNEFGPYNSLLYGNVGRLTLVGAKEDINESLEQVTFKSGIIATALMDYSSGGDTLLQSTSVFRTLGVQPNPFVALDNGSLRFTGNSAGSTGYLQAQASTDTVNSYLTSAANLRPSGGNYYGPENPSTIEFWFKDVTNAFTSAQKLICDFSQYNINLYTENGNWYFQTNSPTLPGHRVVALNVGQDVWHHCAFCSSWGSQYRQIRWYLDGQLKGTIAYPNATTTLRMPRFGAGAIGNLDEFRISNTVRYASNFGTNGAIDRINTDGYMLPLQLDANTLALWRIYPPDGNKFYNDRYYTAFDKGYIDWELTGPSGFKTNLLQYYYSTGV